MKTISIIVPVYNEEKNIPLFFAQVGKVFAQLPQYGYEIIFINDGSQDDSKQAIEKLAAANQQVCYIGFSRNFGKEAATSAGLNHATGDAAIVIDADLQHPTVLIPKFIEAWEKGAEVVIGLRTKNESQSFMKAIGSFFYYKTINFISQTPIVKGATDFRLVDRRVIDEFNKFSEHERITRGLIDWLGFRRQFVEFTADKRAHGVASYSYLKLIKLAISSSVAHSLIPLKLAGYLGIFIFITTGIGGLAIFIQRYIFDDVLNWHISGTAQLAVLIIFFIGIVLSCLGLIALYIGNIYSEVLGRPLYVIRTKVNIKEK